ncbi:MAG: putative peptidoglycan glycosyltransferase FtsW [Candidatus Limnocylindrales bacterium]
MSAASRPVPQGGRRSAGGRSDTGSTASRRSQAAALSVERAGAVRASSADGNGGVVKGPIRERHEADTGIIIATVMLAAMGVAMIYSAGASEIARGKLPNTLAPELIWVSLGVVVMLITSRIDYRFLRLISVPLFLVAVALLVIVLGPSLGILQPIKVSETARWLSIAGVVTFHPAEIAKLALVVYLAHWMARRGTSIGGIRSGTVPFLLIAGGVIALVALEPDLGTTGVITLTAFTMLFVAGGSIWQLLVMIPAGVVAVGLYISTSEYQHQRWVTFQDPWADATGHGYHTVQGLLALGLGGLTGQGIGSSRGPGGLPLPAADNDFVFAMLGQELGLWGGALVIALFGFIAWRGIRISQRAPDTFGALLALGVSVCLVYQAFMNIAVVLQLVPLTGITLPFVSSGNSSLLVSFAAVGILLSISRETRHTGPDGDARARRGWWHRRPHLPRPRRPSGAPAPTAGS